PIIDLDRGTVYWTRRHLLLKMLNQVVNERGGGRIRVLYASRFTGFADEPDGRVTATAVNDAGEELRFSPDLVLACDGIGSAVRSALGARSEAAGGAFDLVTRPSLSTGLMFKVLHLPRRIPVAGPFGEAGDHAMTYAFQSRHTDRRRALALFAFPVPDHDDRRTVNIIREADHHIWTLRTGEAVRDFLNDAFPQLDMATIIPFTEFESFAALEPGSFPAPQHPKRLQASLGAGDRRLPCVLTGDAAHAFPPDLGLGVNSALEDLLALEAALSAHPGDLEAGAQAYETARLPESASLVRLVQTVFPEQYNHRPARLKLWILGFATRAILNRVAPALFDKHVYFLRHNPDFSYSELMRRKRRTDAAVYTLLAGLAAVLAGGLAYWMV
ncbi:MAG: FAD-dependent monooxygenase, partial [Caulobacterales bacterium]|nr:FAD-dependent monooxygenase [Caulobacterales bacterium]